MLLIFRIVLSYGLYWVFEKGETNQNNRRNINLS